MRSLTLATCLMGTFFGMILGMGALPLGIIILGGFGGAFGSLPMTALRDIVVAVRAAPLTIPPASADVLLSSS